MNKVRIIKGRDKQIDIFISDSQKKPISIAGYTQIKCVIPRKCGTNLTKFYPKVLGTNAIQSLARSAVPDSGTFKLKYAETGEITAALNFDADATAIQTALNALNGLSGVVVTGVGPFAIEFAGNDGKRVQELLEVVDSTLLNGVTAVTSTITTTQTGVPVSGIDVVEEACGHIRLFLSEDDVDLLDVGKDQDIDVRIRKGDSDMDIEPLYRVLDVLPAPGEK